MSPQFDIAIIGTGPAGVSAAFPLVERGLRVLLIDGGAFTPHTPPDRRYLDLRRADDDQWEWMIGKDFHALRGVGQATASPKFRAPTLKNVFAGFAEENAIHSENFDVVGSIVTGGLSNAWGCGVSRFDERDLSLFPLSATELVESYGRVARRIGISGGNDDDLSAYYGLDAWSQTAVALDDLHAAVFATYQTRRSALLGMGVRIGRSRLAVLNEDSGKRQKCGELGTCLWGCARGSLYSAHAEVLRLRRQANVTVRNDFIAQRLSRGVGAWTIQGRDRKDQSPQTISACAILVAAGCIATSRIIYDSLDLVGEPRRLLSTPSAAFLVCFPAWIGAPARSGPKVSLLSFALSRDGGTSSGFLFPTDGLPVSEFVGSVPLPSRYAIDILKHLLPASVVGNVFFSGELSQHTMTLSDDRQLKIVGGLSEDFGSVFTDVTKRLVTAFRELGGFVPPGGFVPGNLGSDVHYAGGVPMHANPSRGESAASGEVTGMPGVFVVDGASLPYLPAKPHTLTIMANADRIARGLSQRWEAAASTFVQG